MIENLFTIGNDLECTNNIGGTNKKFKLSIRKLN
jgi:hypothetical protein